MSQTDRHRSFGGAAQGRVVPVVSEYASVVYRSRAVVPPSDYELYRLVQAAQMRNAKESITGLLLYDDGRFYQWLEGPGDSLARVMRSISGDERHQDLEILVEKPIQKRQFAGWQMRLATRGVRSIHSVHNVVVPSAEVLEDIRLHADHVALVLAGFAPAMIGDRVEEELAAPALKSNGPLKGAAEALLQNVIVTAVLPEMLARHEGKGVPLPWPINGQARALADLLIGADDGAAIAFLRSLQHCEGSVRHLYRTVVEPTARMLGNLWRSDQCSEFDVTFGLCQLQRAIRSLNEAVVPPAVIDSVLLPSVMVVPEPGELHAMSAFLDSDVLETAGWDMLSEYPATDEALQDIMAGRWFDALDLSLSAAFRRDHWMARVSKTIAMARHASVNPHLLVIVGGRLFVEDYAAGAQVGADGVSVTASQAERVIRDGLRRIRSV